MVNFGSMFIFITKCTQKTRLEIGRGQVYIYNLFIFSPYRYSSSPQLTRHKIHSDTQKSFDPPLRTKPNYSLPKLTLKIYPKNHNKTTQFHTLSPLPYQTTLPHPNPNKFNTNKQNITQNTKPTQYFYIKPHSKHKPQQNSTQTPNNTTYTQNQHLNLTTHQT